MILATPEMSSCSDAETPDERFTGCNDNEDIEEINAFDKEEENSRVNFQDNVDHDNISNEDMKRTMNYRSWRVRSWMVV